MGAAHLPVGVRRPQEARRKGRQDGQPPGTRRGAVFVVRKPLLPSSPAIRSSLLHVSLPVHFALLPSLPRPVPPNPPSRRQHRGGPSMSPTVRLFTTSWPELTQPHAADSGTVPSAKRQREGWSGPAGLPFPPQPTDRPSAVCIAGRPRGGVRRAAPASEGGVASGRGFRARGTLEKTRR